MNSDKSQPVKITLMVVFMLGVGFFGWKLIGTLNKIETATRDVQIAVENLKQPRLGFSSTELNFGTAINASQACGSSTRVVNATDTARTSFLAANDASTTIYLCRSGICTATSGIPLVPTSSALFKQTDGYIGGYSCLAPAATATTTYPLFYSYSQ